MKINMERQKKEARWGKGERIIKKGKVGKWRGKKTETKSKTEKC